MAIENEDGGHGLVPGRGADKRMDGQVGQAGFNFRHIHLIPMCYYRHSAHRGCRDATRERATVALVAPIPVDGWFAGTLVSRGGRLW
jgi:hypothetical protein